MKRQLLFLILATIGIVFNTIAREYIPADIPNIHIQDRNRFVSDPDNLLSTEVRNAIDTKLRALTDSTTTEVAVVIVESIGDRDAFQFARELFSLWGIGKKDRDNGILLLIAMESHDARIITGYGIEGVLPDIYAMKILRNDLFPAMRRGDIDNAVYSTVNRICEVLSDPLVAEELRSSEVEKQGALQTVDSGMLISLVCYAATILFAVMLIIFIKSLVSNKKRDKYHRVITMRSTTRTMIWIAPFTFGATLLLALISFLITRNLRNRIVKCEYCNTDMKKLPEDEDNHYLSPSQDFEEKIKSVDYDVWLCPCCGSREIYPFDNSQSVYKECTSCHTKALRFVKEHTIVAPTTLHSGVAEKIYECKYCGHHDIKRITLPKLVAPVIIGGIGKGGGGFGGGSFGGGMTGGGGAGGRW